MSSRSSDDRELIDEQIHYVRSTGAFFWAQGGRAP